MTSAFAAELLLLLPVLLAPTFSVLAALSHEITKAERKWLDFKRIVLRLKGAAAAGEDVGQWCSHRAAAPASVYLVTSSIDRLDSGSTRKPRDNQPLADPEMEFMNRSEYVQRAIIVRGIAYELVRKKGSREVGLKIHEVGSEITVDAPCALHHDAWVHKIGVTFLPNEKIREIVVTVETCRDTQDTVEVGYDPVFSKYQTYWNQTRELIVCQCPDQEPLPRPPDHGGPIKASTVTSPIHTQIQGSIASLFHHQRIPLIHQLLGFTPFSWPRLTVWAHLAVQHIAWSYRYNFTFRKRGLWHDLNTGTCNILSPWCDAVAAFHGRRVADFSVAELQGHAKRARVPGNRTYELLSELVPDKLRERERAAAAAGYDEDRAMHRETEVILCGHIYDLGQWYLCGGSVGFFCDIMYRLVGYDEFRYVALAVDLALWWKLRHATLITDGIYEAQSTQCRVLRTERVRTDV